MSFPHRLGQQNELFDGKPHAQNRAKPQLRQFDKEVLTRLSPNFILRDFLFSTQTSLMGVPNVPEDMDMVIRAGRALCEKVLEPVLDHFGRFAIVFGYQCREVIELQVTAAATPIHPRSSSPHQWDRKTFGDKIYARVDILPFCVEDAHVTKHKFGHWLMHHCDIDLLMQWERSNVACITISPAPRRVWLQWNSAKPGRPNRTTYMGAEYWQEVYPTLPVRQRPRFGPSATGGAMQWRVRS